MNLLHVTPKTLKHCLCGLVTLLLGAVATAAPNDAGFLYRNGTFRTIDVPGSLRTTAEGINNAGWIVGTYDMEATLASHGYLLIGNVITTIDVPGAKATRAEGINDLGQVVGTFFDADSRMHGFMWADNQFKIITYPGAHDTLLSDINNRGDLVGTGIGDLQVAFRYANGAFTELLPPGGQASLGGGINDAGAVVGVSNTPLGAFLYTGGIYSAPFAEMGNSFANDINNMGDVAGFVNNCCIGLVTRGGSSETFAYPDALLTQANGLNDLGDIVGRFYGPVPEPSTQALLALGLAGLAAVSGRGRRSGNARALPDSGSGK